MLEKIKSKQESRGSFMNFDQKLEVLKQKKKKRKK